MNKEKNMLKPFMEMPTRHWHFEEILKEADISRPQASIWLRKLIKKSFIKRTKEKGKMPYYTANYENPDFQLIKKIYALEEMGESGLIRHLSSLPKAKDVIIFGSMARWDWHRGSDIDLFIYGAPDGLETGIYRKKLHKEIQAFICRDKNELKKLSPALLRNIAEGHIVKGSLDFLQVKANA